ncbi:response regulator [Rhodocytophaga aerolata]|uniref:Response regulator n=1 Tax=Rhodocytophaga aerolata TaxID=455078 RepID=A0ABT8RHG5_9BACT|nr:response regulator [Rhodocytophaga aerolata]MDO1451536.1 response regulator [Rhodocytophaga aerolata]
MKQLDSILLIDDDAVTNFLHKCLLDELKVASKVYICENGQKALDFLQDCAQRQAWPALIFVDINMPVMNGMEFLEEYKARNYHQLFPGVVKVLTTSVNPKDIEKITRLGIAPYLEKPLKKEHIE